MILIAGHCCICRLAIRDPDAYHEINEALLNATRPDRKTKTRITGVRQLARKYEYLWPDKPGQSKEQKADSLRHSLTDHIPHIGEKIEAVKAEEKEHAKDLNEIAEEVIRLCTDNAKDARKYAELTKRPQDFMFSSNAASHVLNFISKIKPKEDSEDAPGIDKAIAEMKARRDARGK